MLTLWSIEVQHVPIFLEHVDLLDPVDSLDIELLQSRLQFFVILRCRGTALLDHLPS